MPAFLPRALMKVAVACALFAGSPVSAADLALVIGISDYRRLENVSEAKKLRPLVRQLGREGFDVVELFDGDHGDMLDVAARFRRQAREADRILIVLDGHFVSSENDAWLLGRDARSVDPLNVPAQGLSLTGLAQVSGDAASGRAVIFLGRSSDMRPGSGLRSGTHGLNLPQGVTLARGRTDQLHKAIFEGLLREGVSLNDALSNLSARGFLSASVGYTQGAGESAVPDNSALSESSREEGFWEAVRVIDTEPALRLYIQRYPDGRFQNAAGARIAALRDDTKNRWERLEKELNLSRSQRRQVQRDLTLLGYGTRGVDGIFGPGSRGAIGRWQRDRGQEETGFLTRSQVRLISDEAGDRRAAQAEEARQAESAYWKQTGAQGTLEGLRAYVKRYPNGRFADEARARINEIVAASEEENRRVIRRAWQRAQDADTAQGYQEFLNRYPNSRFSEAARSRLGALTNSEEDRLMETAMSQESQNLGNSVVRLMVEQRLTQMGYQPGLIDGKFDNKTRDALRRFQGHRGIFESGYVTNRTAAFLLSGR